MSENILKSIFLGPKGENGNLLEELIVEAMRDHIHWRRNFHPEDDILISEMDKQNPDGFQEKVIQLKHEFFQLLEELKNGVPFFSPRYIGHMTADMLIPAMLGYFATMLYNQNNVTSEASPTTTRMELEVGQHLAKMVGYLNQDTLNEVVKGIRSKKDKSPSWGHISSGGTVANFEALWVARNLKYYPFAVKDLLSSNIFEFNQSLKVKYAGKDINLLDADSWTLLNLSPNEIIELRKRLITLYIDTYFANRANDTNGEIKQKAGEAIDREIKKYLFQEIGAIRFTREKLGKQHPGVVLVSRTKHYSWLKISEALGLGREQLIFIPLDSYYRMSIPDLREKLCRLRDEKIPVIQLTSVCASTEEGAIDTLEEIINLRKEMAEGGFNFYIHADAAYGGYLTSLLYDETGKENRGIINRLAERITEMILGKRVTFDSIPQDNPIKKWATHLYSSLYALRETESVTVDPHKLGYVPYPAGGIVFRNKGVRDLISCHAPYVFNQEGGGETVFIGRYILEGSKPGAAATACWLAHKILPQNSEGYGLLLGETLIAARILNHKLQDFASEDYRTFTVFEPDSNLVCFVVNRKDNPYLSIMNDINNRIYQKLSIPVDDIRKKVLPIPSLDYLISKTIFSYEEYGPEDKSENKANPALQLLGKCRIYGHCFCNDLQEYPHLKRSKICESPQPKGSATGIIILRMTVMDPWLLKRRKGDESFLSGFMGYLQEVLSDRTFDEESLKKIAKLS